MPDQKGHPLLSGGTIIPKDKIVTAEEAVRLIRDGATVATGGFVGIGFAEAIAIPIEKHFLDQGRPRDLTLVYAAGQGDGKGSGLNHFGHKGLVRRVIGGHWGLVPQAAETRHRQRDRGLQPAPGRHQPPVPRHRRRQAGHRDPRRHRHLRRSAPRRRQDQRRHDRGHRRDRDLGGEEYLFYKARPIDVAILRGTSADPDGNITMEKEALILEALAIATAARNSGGVVIVQVERIAESGSLNPRLVRIPGILVDCVVVAEPEHHWQTFGTAYNPAFSGEIRVPMRAIAPMEMGPRKIIARRAAFELRPTASSISASACRKVSPTSPTRSRHWDT